MTHFPVTLSRREFGVLATLSVAASGLVACAPAEPEEDDLWSLLEAARADASDLASGADSGADGATALRRVAETREAHAESLAVEIARRSPGDSVPGSANSPGPSEPAPEASPLDLAAARARLADSADAARAVAVTKSEYRSELCASIAAACTAAAEVLLS